MADESWEESRLFILSELQRIAKAVGDMDANVDKRLTKMNEDIVSLKVKAGLWGFVCGLIPSALTVWATKQ